MNGPIYSTLSVCNIVMCIIWSNLVIHTWFLHFIRLLLIWMWNLAVICKGYQHLLGSCSYCSLPWKVPTKCNNYIENCRCCFILSTYGTKCDMFFPLYPPSFPPFSINACFLVIELIQSSYGQYCFFARYREFYEV